MRQNIIKIFLLVLFVLPFISFLSINKVEAAGGDFGDNCEQPLGIPTGCTNYEINSDCVRRKFLDSTTVCCPNRCVDEGTINEEPEESLFTSLNIFGTTVSINFSNLQTIPTLVNLALTTILGIVSVYVLIRGIYVAAFVRTSTNDPAKIAAVNMELKNLFIGFALAWGAIFIVQAVANIIGIGSLNNLQLTGIQGAYVITIN